MLSLADVAAKFKLDFDDAYQYSVAIRHGLKIVSFDADFDRTPEGRLLPTDVLQVPLAPSANLQSSPCSKCEKPRSSADRYNPSA